MIARKNIPARLLGAFAMSILAAASPRASGEKYVVYIGSIGTANRIVAFALDADSGGMKPLGECATTTRPGYLAVSADNRFLYAVCCPTGNTRDPGTLNAFAIDPATWKLAPLGGQPSEGKNPAYICIDRSGKWLLDANFESGSVGVFPIKPDGGIGPASDRIQFSGKGTNPARQAGPHSHSIGLSPDNKFAFVADLGLDKLFEYRFDAASGKLIPADPPFMEIEPGSGPRHFQFSADGKFIYLLSEIKSTLTVFAYDAATGGLRKLQAVSLLPEDFKGTNTASAVRIHPNGKWLYTANRGDDSIVRFSIDAKTGLVAPGERTPAVGKTPREFGIDPTGRWMIVGAQDGDSIQEFKIDQETGKLAATDQKFPANHPSDFKFVPVK